MRGTLAFAAAPLALSLLLLWPLRLALYGGDPLLLGRLRRKGCRADADRLELVFVGWSVVLPRRGRTGCLRPQPAPRAGDAGARDGHLFAIFLVIDLLG